MTEQYVLADAGHDAERARLEVGTSVGVWGRKPS
jgi:hypothetical protein